MAVTGGTRRIVGGVDTHKDLHVAAVVDEQDRVIGTRSFATTRQGYRQMLAWMRSFGELQRIGIESTGSYGAGDKVIRASGFNRSRIISFRRANAIAISVLFSDNSTA